MAFGLPLPHRVKYFSATCRIREIMWNNFKVKRQRSAPTTIKVVGLLSCKALVQKKTQHGYNSANEHSLADFILVSQCMLISRLLWDVFWRLQFRNTLICSLACTNYLFDEKQSWYCFACLNAEFCLGITKKPNKILHSESKVTQGNC